MTLLLTACTAPARRPRLTRPGPAATAAATAAAAYLPSAREAAQRRPCWSRGWRRPGHNRHVAATRCAGRRRLRRTQPGDAAGTFPARSRTGDMSTLPQEVLALA